MEIYDTDGIAVAQANLGVFTPFTSQATWQSMYDDGSNGDAVANDGIYSVEMQVRSSTPIGTHEVLIQASDVYGKVSPTTSIAVQLVEEHIDLAWCKWFILIDWRLTGCSGCLWNWGRSRCRHFDSEQT